MTNTYGIKGFTMVTGDSPLAMKTALYKYGPVAVGIHAGENIKLYSSGLFYDFEW
jgi:hypothetical protein